MTGGPGEQTAADEAADEPYACPMPATHDKAVEAHYFLSRMLEEFHEPAPFRWNLNAHLQALRSTTLLLQSELSDRDGFEGWYRPIKERLEVDPLLKRFVKGRNITVHKGQLTHRSSVDAGVFRGRQLKLAYAAPVSPLVPSKELLDDVKEHMADFLMDEEHSAIGEQLGVKRSWRVDELGDDEVVTLCHKAMARISTVIKEAHEFCGVMTDEIPEDSNWHDVEQVNVLLESDLDPALPEQWGW